MFAFPLLNGSFIWWFFFDFSRLRACALCVLLLLFLKQILQIAVRGIIGIIKPANRTDKLEEFRRHADIELDRDACQLPRDEITLGRRALL